MERGEVVDAANGEIGTRSFGSSFFPIPKNDKNRPTSDGILICLERILSQCSGFHAEITPIFVPGLILYRA